MTAVVHQYMGWRLQELRRGCWLLVRNRDAFRTHHHSLEGGKAFIRCHGAADDPDADYEAAS